MAKTALNQLQEQIEAIRKEAYAAGYRDAMQAVRELAGREPGAAPASSRPARAPATPAPRARQQRRRPAEAAARATRPRPAARRPQRGSNAKLIEEVLQAIAPRAVRPTEIRNALRRDKGVAMAFTSIRHALGQLEARRAAEQIPNTKTWRYVATAES
jgi:hypothetical protein